MSDERPSIPQPSSLLLHAHPDLPEGIEIHRDFPRVSDETERFLIFDRETRTGEWVEFSWTPFARVAYRRTGLFSFKPIRTYDYNAMDERRKTLAIAAIERMLDAR